MAPMARRTTTPPPPDDFEEHILDTNIGDEMQSSFLEYAYSVIYSRALPDARDGLKPVQRRILYTMNEMGVRPDRGHVKSARVVGEVMGKLHPHGDGAIYDALVRMAQPWSMRLPMIDGHGNFGSPDDSPAAMRYTECRMAPAAVAMTASIDEDTVDFKPNYDRRETEPVVLPSAIPNLIVNGTTGIAVGMATNIAPHNLVEVVQALRHLITTPKATLDDLMRFIPGPDLPTGGKIVGLDGIRDAYETGRGTFRMRATARVETVTARRKGIVVTELPYGVGTERVIERIKALVLAKKLQGIADIKDLTDRAHGLRLVIEVKNGFVPEALLEQLYKLTPMEDSFGINTVALVDGQPRTLGLKELLEVFLGHRFDVVRRRSEFRRSKAADRLHLVDGLLIAILDIDEVIQVIRTSDNAAAAKERLIDDLRAVRGRRPTTSSTCRCAGSRSSASSSWTRRRPSSSATIEELDAILGRREDAAQGRLRRARRGRQDLRHPASYGPARRRPAPPPRRPRPRSRWPTTRASPTSPPAACWPASGNAELPGQGERPRQPRRRSSRRSATTARGEVGVLTSRGPAAQARRARPARAARLGQRPQPPGRAAAQRDAAARGRRARAGPAPRWPPTGPGLALGTRDGVVKRVNPEVLGRDEWDVISLKDGDEVVGAVELAHRRRDALLHHHRRPAAALRRRRRPPAGPLRRRHRRRQARRRASGSSFFGALDPATAVVVTASGASHRAARHRGRARSR